MNRLSAICLALLALYTSCMHSMDTTKDVSDLQNEINKCITVHHGHWGNKKPGTQNKNFTYAYTVHRSADEGECFFVGTMVKSGDAKEQKTAAYKKAQAINEEIGALSVSFWDRVENVYYNFVKRSPMIHKIAFHLQKKQKKDTDFSTVVIPLSNELPPHELDHIFDGEKTVYLIPDKKTLNTIYSKKREKCVDEKKFQIECQFAASKHYMIPYRKFIAFYTYQHNYAQEMEQHLKEQLGEYQIPVLAIDKVKIVALLRRIQQQEAKKSGGNSIGRTIYDLARSYIDV